MDSLSTDKSSQCSPVQEAVEATGAIVAFEMIGQRLYDVPGGPRDLTEWQLIDYAAKRYR